MDRLKEVERFFRFDAMLKQTMYDLAPLSYMSNDECINYSNNVYDTLRDLKFEIVKQAKTFFPNISDNIETKMNELIIDFVECGTSYDKLKNFYNNKISDLRPNYVTEVGANSTGFMMGLLDEKQEDLILKSRTLNEMLHSMHSFIMSNEKLYTSSNFIGKKNEIDFCCFYGVENESILSLRETLNLDTFRVGDIQGLSMDDKLVMMIRNKGHATIVDLDFNEDKVLINYHIPKLCNVDMIYQLPGINKVDINNNYATGQFEIAKEDLNIAMLKFVFNIPSDENMNDIDYSNNTIKKNNFEHFEFLDIIEDLKLKDVAKIFKANPYFYEMDGAIDYLQSRVQAENEHIDSFYQVIKGQKESDTKTFEDFVNAFYNTDICKKIGKNPYSLGELAKEYSNEIIIKDIKIILSKPKNQESLQQFQDNVTKIVNEKIEGIKELNDIIENGVEKQKQEQLNFS